MPQTPPSRARRLRSAASVAGLAASLLRRSALTRFPALSLEERLSMLPTEAAGLEAPLAIRWNAHHVPLVEAATERDGAFGLGLVQAHLRLAQMEAMRRVAYGRLAEVAGPPAVPLDHVLRCLDFPRATAASLAFLPERTRAYLEAFRDGINTVIANGPTPPEFTVLGLDLEPFTLEDLFAVSRLCSADYTWRIWRSLSRLRQEPSWPALWADLAGLGATEPTTDPEPDIGTATRFAPHGSNAWAVSGLRTASGKPILACDPHLLIAAPGPWLIAGLKLPDLTLWGIMIPALPIFGIGRNDSGAWGGTNLHATSSELVDVAAEPLQSREITIEVRGRRPQTRTVRESSFGPVVSDTPLLELPDETVALDWMGHRPGDAFTPFLDLMRARDWREFRAAADGMSLPGLTFVYAGTDGTIGKAIACHLPNRPLGLPADIVTTPAEARTHWSRILTGAELPHEHDPASGYVASANDAPEAPPVTISLYFAAAHRIDRLRALLGARHDLTREDMMAFQADTFLAPAKAIATRLATAGTRLRPESPLLAALANWDGRYDARSAGALAFELLAAELVTALSPRIDAPSLMVHWRPFVRLSRLLDGAADDVLAEVLPAAIDAAEAPFARHATWGGLHRLRLAHPLSRLPWLSPRLPTLDLAVGGSNETVMKSAHPVTGEVHGTTFGANARFIADLADPDETHAVLLGGQDGWPGSRTMFDMVGPFREGHYLTLPRRPAVVAREFPHLTTLAPRPPDA